MSVNNELLNPHHLTQDFIKYPSSLNNCQNEKYIFVEKYKFYRKEGKFKIKKMRVLNLNYKSPEKSNSSNSSLVTDDNNLVI